MTRKDYKAIAAILNKRRVYPGGGGIRSYIYHAAELETSLAAYFGSVSIRFDYKQFMDAVRHP